MEHLSVRMLKLIIGVVGNINKCYNVFVIDISSICCNQAGLHLICVTSQGGTIEMIKHFRKHAVFYGFLRRFTLTHVITYLVCGLIFMNLMGYENEFLSNDSFMHFRPLDSPIVQAAVLFQFIRGGMFASILYPFRERIIGSRFGWIMLFAVIWGMTCLGAVNTASGSIEGFIYTEVSLKSHLIGMPEVISQALLFSVLFWLWERRSEDNSIFSRNMFDRTRFM